MSATAKSVRPEGVWRETVREKRWLRTAGAGEALCLDTLRKMDIRCIGTLQPATGDQDTVALLLLVARIAPVNDVYAC